MLAQKIRQLLNGEDSAVDASDPHQEYFTIVKSESVLKRIASVLLALALMPLLPVILLFKTLEYVHLITFVVFGVLLLYFGFTKAFQNSWTDSALLLGVGAILVIAPLAYVFDKRK